MEKIFNIGGKLENGWRGASGRKRIWIYIGAYTLAFLAAFLIAFSPYIQAGKSFVWRVDGPTQHYPAAVYIGRYLRRAVNALLHGKFSIPLFDLGINMGGDIMGTLNGNGHMDPSYILSAFVPVAYSEYLYCFLNVLWAWSAGLSFSYLCFYHKKRAPHVLIGSIIYSFSSYAVISIARHPHFLLPMVQLPLLLVGIDKLLKKQKPYLFVFALFWAVIGDGYYHVYQMTLMLVIYAAVRFFDLYKKDRPREFLRAVGRCAAGYCLGIGLSALIFLPSVLNYLYSARNGMSNLSPVKYDWAYFRRRILWMISPDANEIWAYLGMAAIVLLAVVLLTASRKRRSLKILLLIGTLFWVSSIGGFIMHGFQYSTNRWVYGFVLLLSYIAVEMLPSLTDMTAKERLICAGTLCVFLAMALCGQKARKLQYVLVGALFLALTVWVLSARLDIGAPRSPRRTEGIFRSALCLCLVVFNVGVIGVYRAAPDQGNYVGEMHDLGASADQLVNSAERSILPLVAENPQGRADSTEFGFQLTDVWSVPKIPFYDSLLNQNVAAFWNATESIGQFTSFRKESSEQRTLTNALLSVKYQIEPEGRAGYLPYGYSAIGEDDSARTIYENRYALPWGYTYDTVMSYEELDALNGLEKQEAMLQAVALEDASVPDGGTALDFDEQIIPYKAAFDGCAYENGVLSVTRTDAAVTLSFAMPAGVEGYVRLADLDLDDSGVESFKVAVAAGDVSRSALAQSKLYRYYDGSSNDLLFNLGYSDKERQELTITFPVKGTFKLGGIELYALPMDNYPARVEALRAEPLENIQWGTNKLTGTVDLTRDKILCVSVPYSKGWTATVDGKEVEILRGNYMFMCIPLAGGYHEIELRYCSPGLKLGAAVTCCSAAVLACMYARGRKRRLPVK